MTPLGVKLRERIARCGPIPVAEFMAAANGDPEHGYYARRDPLGRRGDFITAPEISQVFGELIGAFEFGDERTVSGNYGLANVRVGMQTDRYEWSVFADNITDNRALVFANGPANEFRRTIILQPRTLGLQFRSRF